MFKTSQVRIVAFLFMLIPGFAMADVIEDVLARGTLRIGVAKFVPWTFETNSGELDGFDVEVGRKIAKDMNVNAEFKVYVFEEIFSALRKGDIDVIATGLAITPSRALRINFTIPYMESGVGIATNIELTKDIKSFLEMNRTGIVIATVRDTLASEFGKKFFDKAKVTMFASKNEAEAAVLEGRAHAYLASVPEVSFFSLQNKTAIDLPMKKPLLASKAGLGVKKGEQEWLNFLNSWITARDADRWLASTYSYWFGSLDWVKDVKQ
ncbi:MAG: transporter substrate-binding domain-containing protein [Hyphomicrobiales bacterium]|nr:transporter substrate-binding domain-containing protein [Hyphomicrobiales bacterium]